MKRDIRCTKCGELPHRTSWEDGPNAGYEKRRGLLNCECRCDLCNKLLPKDSPAYAVTFHRGDYFPWEQEYIREER